MERGKKCGRRECEGSTLRVGPKSFQIITYSLYIFIHYNFFFIHMLLSLLVLLLLLLLPQTVVAS